MTLHVVCPAHQSKSSIPTNNM